MKADVFGMILQRVTCPFQWLGLLPQLQIDFEALSHRDDNRLFAQAALRLMPSHSYLMKNNSVCLTILSSHFLN